MKKYLFSSILGFSLLAFGTSAMAAFSIDELQAAAASALDDFKQNNPGHVPHFTGYKAWNSGEDSKVKIYVSHDGMNMEFNYLCMKHDTSIACHAQ